MVEIEVMLNGESGKVNKARTYSLIPDHTKYDDDAGIICSVSKSNFN